MIRNRISTVLGERRENITDLSRGAGISYDTAHGLYHERRQRVDLSVLERICRYLGRDIGDVLYLDPPLDKETKNG